jgi:5-methylcytosine-specific restriction enzyme B
MPYVIYNGKLYPPKLVISWANEYTNEVELDWKTFHGGNNTDAFNLLRKEGFIIQKKNNS